MNIPRKSGGDNRQPAAHTLRTLAIAIIGAAIVLLAPFCAFSSFQRFKRYMVPNKLPGETPRTAAFGLWEEMILRSKRTSDGRRHDGDEIAFLISILDEAEQDGFDDLEVVVHYRKTNTEVTYATTIPYLREHGQRVLGVSGWELSMPRCMWSIDGNPPTGKPQSKPAPEATQTALFDFVEPVQRKVGAY